MNKTEGIKNLFKNYMFYTNMIQESTQKLDVLEYKLAGVSSIRFDKQHGSTNQSYVEEKKHELRDQIEFYRLLKQVSEDSIMLIGRIMRDLSEEERNIVSQVYIMDSANFEELSKDKDITASGLFKKFNKALEEII